MQEEHDTKRPRGTGVFANDDDDDFDDEALGSIADNVSRYLLSFLRQLFRFQPQSTSSWAPRHGSETIS